MMRPGPEKNHETFFTDLRGVADLDFSLPASFAFAFALVFAVASATTDAYFPSSATSCLKTSPRWL